MLNKTELVAKYAELRGTTKAEAERRLSDMICFLGDVIEGGNGFNFVGSMKAEIKEIPERVHRNPKDGSEVIKKAHKKVKLTAMKGWQEAVNK